MSRVNKIIENYEKAVILQNKFIEDIDKKIEELEDKKFNKKFKVTQSHYVLSKLKLIADGVIEEYHTFDDPEIMWYLNEFRHCGPFHKDLENIFNKAIKECGPMSLPFFKFTKEDARNLISEVDNS